MIDQISMDDVGTRLDHILHLRDNWQAALEGLRRRSRLSYVNKNETDLMLMLDRAITLVNCYLTEDFSIIPYATVINNLPKADRTLPPRKEPNA